ncbi:MAG: hypothetical protein HC824_19770 [Synechococcales cyanobacterium RM1_1_8]|nr:hypothetical protein [Synechococcales cyanobacterium RM1_1_8]
MYSSQQVLDAAEVIYPVLPQLLDEPKAAQVQGQLETALFGKDIVTILDTLDQYPQTQRWFAKYTVVSMIHRSGSQLHGDMVAQPSGLIYACPHCDYRDPVFLLGMDPDPCPKHPDAVLQRL